MVIKDVIQEMLDDDMIVQEKVGNNALYWIFPSQSYVLVLFSVSIWWLEEAQAGHTASER